MSEVAQRVAEMLLSTESIQVYRENPFVFVSGRISPVYIDCRKLLSFPAEREYIVTALAKMAEADIGLQHIDVVAGGGLFCRRHDLSVPFRPAAFASQAVSLKNSRSGRPG